MEAAILLVEAASAIESNESNDSTGSNRKDASRQPSLLCCTDRSGAAHAAVEQICQEDAWAALQHTLA